MEVDNQTARWSGIDEATDMREVTSIGELAPCMCSLKRSHTRTHRFMLLLAGLCREDGSLSIDRCFAQHPV